MGSSTGTGTGGGTGSSTGTGTGGSGGGAPGSTEVAVVSTYLGGLHAFTLEPQSGALTEVVGSPFDPGAHLYSVARHPEGTFAYAVDIDAQELSAYRIAPGTGALTPVAGSPFPTDGGPVTVAVDPKGRFVYVGTDISIDVYSIDATDGTLSRTQESPFAIPGAAFIAPDPSGSFVYVSWSGLGGIGAYTVDPTSGALSEIAGSPFGATAAHGGALVFHPNGKFVYSARFGSNGYAIDPASGALSSVPGSKFDDAAGSDPNAIDLAMTPDGKFAYAIASSTHAVLAYAIDGTTGALTPKTGFSFAGGLPYSVAVEPGGKFAYVCNDGGDIAAFSIDPAQGSLTPVASASFPLAGLQPQIAITLSKSAP
jgi:6-phosphogluconolactonase (cycloisomerase 2 family)